jgi:tetratricopeptide (TPR) repeat protein
MAKKRDKILRDAEKLVQKGKIEAAIREYEKLLKETPNDANTINRIGDLYGRIGQVDKAVELYERIADHFTKDGFTTKAIAILKKINRLAPQRLDIFESLAELYIQQGLVVEAKNQYSLLADWYTRNEDVENAINAHRKLVELDPSNHISHLKLADLLIQGGKPDEAIEEYDRLGNMLLERDKLDEAVQLYQHAVEQNPPSGDFLVPICTALMQADRMEEAIGFLKAALERSPKNTELQVLKVQVLIAKGNAGQALQIAEKILAVDPKNETVRQLVGRALLGSGEVEKARSMLLPAAEAHLARSEFSNAQDLLKDLLKAMPKDAAVLKAALRAFAPSGNQEMVFTIKAALAEVYFQANKQDEARRLYLELIDADPNNKQFRQRMAQLDGAAAPQQVEEEPDEIEMEAPETVAAAFEQPAAAPQPTPAPAPTPTPAPAPAPAAAVAPGDFDPQERLAEATVFAKYGLVEKAANYLESILISYPDTVEARERLVNLYIENGQPDRASSIAEPLVGHYRQAGNAEALEILMNSVPGLIEQEPAVAPSGPIAMPASADDLTPAPIAQAEAPQELAPEPVVQPEELGAADDDLIIVDIEDEAAAPSPVAEPAGELVEELELIDEPAAEPIEEIELVDEPTMTTPAEELVVAAQPAPVEEIEEIELVDEPTSETMEESMVVNQPVDATPEEVILIDEPTTISETPDEIELVDEPVAPVAVAPHEVEEIELVDEPTTVGAYPEEIVLLDEPSSAQAVPAAEAPAPAADELVELSDTFAGPSFADLEKLDFFIDQELYDDSVSLLNKLQQEFPEDPDLAERRLALKAKGVLLDDVPLTAGMAPEDLFADEDEYIDIAQELKEELAEDDLVVEEAEGVESGEAELEAVFREFQKGVAEQLSEEDSDTHFNLGIAYREMGLLPEAIREFQIASRDPGYFVECCSMIGVCYLEQGMSVQATEWYRKAMTAPGLTPEGMNALRYDLASALEAAGEVAEAESMFSEITSSDPSFRDVADRLIAISAQRQAN